MEHYYELAEKFNADGVDFIPFCDGLLNGQLWRCKVVMSYTKDELKGNVAIPKTPYVFWKIVDGKKVYCDAS